MQSITEGRTADEGIARDFLTALIQDPYRNATTGEAGGAGGRFGDSINRLFQGQLAKARSGPDIFGQGVARRGFREGEAMASAQDMLIGQGTNAANSLLTNANPLSALNFVSSVAPKKTVASGTTNTVTQNEMDSRTRGTTAGSGTQQGSNWGAGITICCFIFLEAYRGKLPWFVRRCRDEFAAGERRIGYVRMARWLVPAMRVSKAARKLVEWLMVSPMTKFGGWLYDAPGYRFGWTAFPACAFWFYVWKLLGRSK